MLSESEVRSPPDGSLPRLALTLGAPAAAEPGRPLTEALSVALAAVAEAGRAAAVGGGAAGTAAPVARATASSAALRCALSSWPAAAPSSTGACLCGSGRAQVE